jgi:phage tail sheath protein FI
MTLTLNYPGVYIQEIPSGVRPIVGVATSITAFVGRARRGPVGEPVRIGNFGGYTRRFGGLWLDSPMSFAVRQFFQNGGSDAIILRLENGAAASTADLGAGAETLDLTAINDGEWGDSLRATVDFDTADTADTTLFNLIITELDDDGNEVAREEFRNLRNDDQDARYVLTVVNNESDLVRVVVPISTAITPDAGTTAFTNGDDGNALVDADYQGTTTNKNGIFGLEDADLFNLLCLPPRHFGLAADVGDIGNNLWAEAVAYCQDRRAMLLIDPSVDWDETADVTTDFPTLRGTVGAADRPNAAIYFPRLRMVNPLRENRLDTFAPSGAVAGLIANTDAQRGVWKAPAGTEAGFSGVSELSYTLTDFENGQLNPLGVNCLRTFPAYGHVIWGGRTLDGDDRFTSEWKYIPVRRTALFIEESLFRGLQWVVFEPNDEPLWAQIRLNVGSFMQDLFRKGAFQGESPKDAYLVKCDSETTTQSEIDLGIVNILVGFAPLKPAEFVIIQIQQLAGQTQA